jgi:hypothetical protein
MIRIDPLAIAPLDPAILAGRLSASAMRVRRILTSNFRSEFRSDFSSEKICENPWEIAVFCLKAMADPACGPTKAAAKPRLLPNGGR